MYIDNVPSNVESIKSYLWSIGMARDFKNKHSSQCLVILVSSDVSRNLYFCKINYCIFQ